MPILTLPLIRDRISSDNREVTMKAFEKITLTVLAGVILFCTFPGFGLTQTAVTPAKLTGPVPSTKDNYAFLSANRVQSQVDLQKAGYVEEEYIVSGTANVYDWT